MSSGKAREFNGSFISQAMHCALAILESERCDKELHQEASEFLKTVLHKAHSDMAPENYQHWAEISQKHELNGV